MADLEHGIPNTPGTVFHAASLSKQFTAMSIMLLAQKGAINLDQGVHKQFPKFARFAPQVTIRQMLQHTSGIRDMLSLLTLSGWRLSDDVITRNDVLNLLKRMKTTDFVPPGSDWLYSNTDYFLAGEIVSSKCGCSFAKYASENIFVPLGMTSTRFVGTHGEIVGNRAYGYYQPTGQGLFVMRMPSYDLTGPTNLVTTVEDLILWDQHFESGTVSGNSAMAEMLKTVKTKHGYDYGLGLMISADPPDGNVVEHNGRDPGHRAHLVRFRDKQLTVALLCNIQQNDISTFKLVRDVKDRFLGEHPARPENRVQSSTPPFRATKLRQYVGRYYSREIDKSYDIKLEEQSLKVVREKYEPRPLAPVEKDKFRVDHFTDASLVSVLNTVTVQFERSQGKITGFRLDDDDAFPRLRNFRFRKLP